MNRKRDRHLGVWLREQSEGGGRGRRTASRVARTSKDIRRVCRRVAALDSVRMASPTCAAFYSLQQLPIACRNYGAGGKVGEKIKIFLCGEKFHARYGIMMTKHINGELLERVTAVHGCESKTKAVDMALRDMARKTGFRAMVRTPSRESSVLGLRNVAESQCRRRIA